MTSRRILLCALFAAVFPAVLSAGNLITMKQELTSGATSTHKIYLQKGNLRMETKGDERWALYRSDRGFLWVLDPAQKTYMDLDPTTGAGSPAAEYRKVASGVSVNGFVTDEYEVSHGGKKVAEVWLADPHVLNIDPSDAAAFRWMASKVIAQSRSQSGFALNESAPEGLPVRTTFYYNGQKTSTDDFTSVSHQDLPASIFELPEDYKPATFGTTGH